MRSFIRAAAIALTPLIPMTAQADETSDLAQELANPIAAIISVPLQFNYDENLGLNGDGTRKTLNLQPVVPFALDNGATIVTRTIVPYIWQKNVIPGTSQSGLGDIMLNAWYTPANQGGLIWGVGPIVRIPTRTNVSSDTWAAGVTGIALKQSGQWTVGALANHLWDLENNPKTPTNATTIQPFVSYTTASAWSYSLQTEATYDWESEQWSIPINASASKLVMIGGKPVNLMGGIGYWADSPTGGPEDWRLRLQAQFVFPKK
ncbi:transporter [Sedimentimonas flavescens]|uniref:transporter n=1 Tax=Sedimentimonas flavescens TaxID=2851012 RepID=UPI0021A2AE08|nr:transporter [Sedimentimonas flavescens]MCT2541156.1 transporter [Sedimentimonas flavescens]